MSLAQKMVMDSEAYKLLCSCDQILDIGCGDGRFIKQDRDRIVGVDMNQSAVDKCKKLNFNVHKANILDMLNWKLPKQFQGIHLSHVLEHYEPQTAHRILKNVDRLLPTGGVLVIRTPVMHPRFYDDFTHVKPYNPGALRHYLVKGMEQGPHTMEPINHYEEIRFRWRLDHTAYMLALKKLP